MKYLKSFFKIVTILFIILLSLGIFFIFKWWMPWMWNEVPWYTLTETYIKIWDYSIWKQKFQYNICHKENRCLNGKILWAKMKNNNIYVYYKFNYSTVSSINNTTQKETIRWYNYEVYSLDKSKYIDNLNQIPEFWYIDWSWLKFYSEVDLKKLDENKQKIFHDLKINPTIIINWVSH